MKARIQGVVLKPKHIQPYIQAGRLFKVRTNARELGWGVLLNHKKTVNKMGDQIHILEMALRLSWECVKDIQNHDALEPPKPNQSAALEYVPVELSSICGVSQVRVKLPDSPEGQKAKEAIKQTLEVRLQIQSSPSWLGLSL